MTQHNFDPFPKYLQIRDILLRRLLEFDIGDRLPIESTLAAQFGVSRETIREALWALEQDGIIARRPRVGTWLARKPMRPADTRLTGPSEDFTALGISTSTRLVGQGTVAAPSDVATALKIAAGQPVFELVRVRLFDQSPFLLLEAYLPVPIGRKLMRQQLDGGLVVPILRRILRRDVREEYQQIEAVGASAKMARRLRMPVRSAVLCVKRLFCDPSGRPVVFFKVNYRGDRYYYTVNLPQAQARRGNAPPASRRRKGAPVGSKRRAAPSRPR
jgi:GntR family transcriptional regulator